ELAFVEAAEEAFVRRLDHVLGIDLAPQPGVELVVRQADQSVCEALEDFAGGGAVTGLKPGDPVRERILLVGHGRLAPCPETRSGCETPKVLILGRFSGRSGLIPLETWRGQRREGPTHLSRGPGPVSGRRCPPPALWP